MNEDKHTMSADIKRIGAIVWKNAKNYGVNCIGLLILYVGLSLCLQLFWNLEPIYATAISNVLCTILCGSIYIKNRLLKVPSFQKHNELTTKSIILCSIYMVISTFVILLFFYWSINHIYDAGMDNRAERLSTMTVSTYIWFSMILSPIAEEVIMRLFLYNSLKRTSHWIVSMLVSSFAFAILHNTLAHTVLALCFGIILTLVYEYTGSWWLIIIYHMLYNFVSLFFKMPDVLVNNNTLVVICFILFISGLLSHIVQMNRQMSLINYRDE